MRKKFLIFLGIFIFMIIPKNVYAKEVIPVSSIINNQHFSDNSATNNVSVSTTINAGASFTYNIIVTNGSAYEGNNVFLDYPYVQLYFYSNRSDLDKVSRLTFSQTSTCNISCFNSYNMSIYKLNTGQYADGIAYRYVMVLPIAKFNQNPDLGDSEVTGSIQFTNRGNNAFFIRMTNVVISDSPIIDVNNNIVLALDDFSTNITNTLNTQFTAINTAMSTQHQDLTNINNSLNNETAPSNSDFTSQISNIGVAPNTAVSNLVLLPINFINRLIDVSDNQCTSYDLGSLYGTNLVLPCITPVSYFGSDLWNLIDCLFCFFMIYNFAMLCITAWEDFTSLRDDYNSLYSPKHTYQPKHGGD